MALKIESFVPVFRSLKGGFVEKLIPLAVKLFKRERERGRDLPDRIQIGRHSSSTLLGFADMYGDVWIGRARLVLGDQALRTDDWARKKEAENKRES